MRLIVINVYQVERVIRHQSVRAALLDLSVKLTYKHHHVCGLIPEFIKMIVEKLLIIQVGIMSIFHIKERKIGKNA